ncbi:MAG: histidine--tRNA ligase [Patescibacteria group bacterium]|nr:histidine--tRNA ligase [Patescibacteria group bacterium]
MPHRKNNRNNNQRRDPFHKEELKQRGLSEKFVRLRGMKDIIFDENKYWDLVIKKASDLAEIYGFKKIQTPILEGLELYRKSTGETSDIVSKEMYSFVDKNGEKVALRPEITPSLVRAYIENGMLNMPHPVKMYSYGPIFRHEKPQAGRYRQSHQFDMEIFGEASPVADFLLMLIAYNLFSELQIDIELQVNNIGCKQCRGEYIKKLSAYYKERGNRSHLCNDCKRRLERNPLRLLDCKEANCIALKEGAPPIVDFLCEDCKKKFTRVLEYLDEMNIPYNLNLSLVRGLDYYTGTVFEITVREEGEKNPNGQLSLGGGGRYDTLVEFFGGRPTPTCGFAIGIERTVARIKTGGIPLEKDDKNIIFIAQLGDVARRKAMVLFEELRKAGLKVKQAFTRDSLKDQLEEANALGAKLTLILGQKEMNDKTIMVRDMESGNQEVVDYKKVKAEVEKRINTI